MGVAVAECRTGHLIEDGLAVPSYPDPWGVR